MGTPPESALDHAISAVSRRVVTNLVSEHIGEEWENYPELGERDWQRVMDDALRRVGELDPSPDVYHNAYEHLSQRATVD